MGYDYDVAISFAGEQRVTARNLANELEDAGYRVFFDEFESANLWGEDLTVYLDDIYRTRAQYCLILVSEDWVRKAWTNHERKAALSRALNDRSGYILPLTVDGSQIPGYAGIHAYKDLRNTDTAEMLGLLTEKLGAPIRSANSSRVPGKDFEAAEEIIAACFRRAVFTRMASEISLDAMYASLDQALHAIQRIVPRLTTPALQHAANTIIADLDEAQRLTREGGSHVNHLTPERRRQIDHHKEKVLGEMRRIKRIAGLAIQFPTSLRRDYFFSIDDANGPPRERPVK